MRMRIGWSGLFACAAVLILSAPVQAQTTQVFDPAWMKTTSQWNADLVLGVAAKYATDPSLTWTSAVWDGPQQNGNGIAIPNCVPNDFWAKWPFTSGIWGQTQQLFKTTLDLPACSAALLSEVRLVNKYNPASGPILSINDDLYVWVNGAAAAAGGSGPASGRTVHSSWDGKFSVASHPPDSNAVETDYWRIVNGLQLPTALFQAGSNQISVLTDDIAAWGGLGHVVFKVTQSGSCAAIDIKPGSYPNCFNLNSNGVIPVAILGGSTFDATQVDPATLSFNGLSVRVKGNGAPQCSVQNVNGDAYPDLVCQFIDDPGAWIGGTATARLTGNLNDGASFFGSDEICIVP